jgi:metallo-beta-lactamase family protein
MLVIFWDRRRCAWHGSKLEASAQYYSRVMLALLAHRSFATPTPSGTRSAIELTMLSPNQRMAIVFTRRTQEIVYELHQMVNAGQLRGIPIIVDGPLGLSATKIYAKHTECYDTEALDMAHRGNPPLEFDSLFGAKDAQASKRAVNTEGPAVIIAGSGMCQGGRIRHHLLRHLPDPRADILLVGYQAGRTLGRALQEGRTSVYIDGQQVMVRARVTTISGLSAHADREGLASWFDKIPKAPAARAFVTHGEQEQSIAYAQLLTDRFSVAAHAPAMFETVDL